MAKYFLDTEFIEGFHKPFMGKRRHFIDLISIGICCDDGREYYAISNEFDERKADQWVKDNVIAKLEPRSTFMGLLESYDDYPYPIMKENPIWKSNKQIAFDILRFVYDPTGEAWDKWMGPADDYYDMLIHVDDPGLSPQFFAFYADYDWVLFCSLFGRMIDLPKGFPMYCRDLKQMMDERGLATEWKRQVCPDPVGEHNALVDARWNKHLHHMITHHQLQCPSTVRFEIQELRQRINSQQQYIQEIRDSNRNSARKRELVDSAAHIKQVLTTQLYDLLEKNGALK